MANNKRKNDRVSLDIYLNKYVAGVWKKAHAPQSLLKWVARFHAWRRSR